MPSVNYQLLHRKSIVLYFHKWFQVSSSDNQTCNSWQTLGCQLEIYFLHFRMCDAVVKVVLGVRHPMKYRTFGTLVHLLVRANSSVLHLLVISKKGGKRAVSPLLLLTTPLTYLEHF